MTEEILRTKICEILGIRYPIILAGMGGTAGPSLAAAVSNAGGLGVLGAVPLTPEQLRDWIRRTRDMTDKPFGVDLLLPEKFEETGDIDLEAQFPAQVAFVGKLKKELGVAEPKGPHYEWKEMIGEAPSRRRLEITLEEKVPVFAGGLGAPSWAVDMCHAAGVKIIAMVGRVRHARRVVERGADIIGAQGTEAGGHTGKIGTFALVPQVVDAVYPVPVVAAGGIGDGRGLAASLMLGADGVWVGTLFCATHEAGIEATEIGTYTPSSLDAYKHKIIAASEDNTLISRVPTGKTSRNIKTKLFEIWDESEVPPLPMPLQGMLIQNLVRGIHEAGLTDYVYAFAGQVSGMVNEIKSAKQVVEEMVEGAINCLDRFHSR